MKNWKEIRYDFLLRKLNKHCEHCQIDALFFLTAPERINNIARYFVIIERDDFWYDLFSLKSLNKRGVELWLDAGKIASPFWHYTPDFFIEIALTQNLTLPFIKNNLNNLKLDWFLYDNGHPFYSKRKINKIKKIFNQYSDLL